MANSDEYTATMIALGPGLGACVLASLPFNSPSLMGTLLLYPTFLGTFLLGLPALGWCLASACLQQESPGHQRRLIWWAFSLAAPVWHFIVIDACFRSVCHSQSCRMEFDTALRCLPLDCHSGWLPWNCSFTLGHSMKSSVSVFTRVELRYPDYRASMILRAAVA